MALLYKTASNTITRPADTTAYASGDLVANSTTAGSVTPFSWTMGNGASSCRVIAAYVLASNPAIANATFRVHLFGASPVVSAGDNSAIAPTALGAYKYFGSLTGSVALGGGTTGCVVQCAPDVELWGIQGGTVYGLLEARGAYTPTSEQTFIITLTYGLESGG